MLRSIAFFPPEIRADYDLVWRKWLQPDRPQTTIRCSAHETRFECRVTKERTLKQPHNVQYFCFTTATVVA
jgi:hypothetical protein